VVERGRGDKAGRGREPSGRRDKCAGLGLSRGAEKGEGEGYVAFTRARHFLASAVRLPPAKADAGRGRGSSVVPGRRGRSVAPPTKKNWVRTGRTELPVRPLARCRPRTIERRRLPTARGSVSSWRCSSAHFLFLVLSSLPFLHSSSFRSAADRDPWPEPPRIPITGAAVDPHHRSCSRSPSPEPPRCPLPAVPPLPRA